MRTRNLASSTAWSALLAFAMVSPGAIVSAQEADIPPGSPRSVNERLTNESARIPSATDDAARVEAQQNSTMSRSRYGLGVEMLVEHAVSMAIDGSSLKAIAGPVVAGSTELDPLKRLRMKAKKMTSESQSLIGQAASDSKALAANPVVGRLQSAANLYITTLAGLEPNEAAEVAQVAMINQAVKDVLAADHILQMTPIASGNPAMEQLKNHAALMKTQGMELLTNFKAQGSTGDGPSVNVAALADRGRNLVEAASALGRQAGTPGTAAGLPGQAPNPRAPIIGGTYGTGSPGTGTYQGLGHPPGSTLPKTQSEPSPVPNNSSGTTGSTGGLPPR